MKIWPEECLLSLNRSCLVFISQIKSQLPNRHPLHISDAIFNGVAKQAEKIPDF